MMLVVGAGAVGTILSAYLTAAKREPVKLYVRDKDLGALQTVQDIRVEHAGAAYPPIVAPKPVLTRSLALDDIDYLLICVKFPNLDDLLTQIGSVPARCTLVSTLNGIGALRHIRERFPQAREASDLRPLEMGSLPADIQPLVDAVNQQLARTQALMEHRRGFIDDASHQLRTPLATLLTQLSYAQRESEPARVRETLDAMRLQLKHTIRQTNQMLALARADTYELATQATDLSALAGAVTRRWWASAREQEVDLGFEPAPTPAWAALQPELLEEAISNLIDNALRHTPAGGRVTVRVQARPDAVCLHVGDTGPGIPDAELASAGQRFFRASNRQGTGSGLGRCSSVMVSPTGAPSISLMPATTKPTSPHWSVLSGTDFGMNRPSLSTWWLRPVDITRILSPTVSEPFMTRTSETTPT